MLIMTIQFVMVFFAGPVPYYIVKNSWGTDFGLNGYVQVKAGGNTCGEPHYDIMSAYLTVGSGLIIFVHIFLPTHFSVHVNLL